MLHFLLQLPSAGFPQQSPGIPELPPGPSLDRTRGPIEIPFLETWQTTLITLLCLVVAALISWKFLRYIQAKKKRNATVSPQDTAVAELKSAAELTAKDDERFAVLSSLALRRYFETSKGIDALGRTTDEFLKDLSDHSLLNADTRKLLAECLQHCDRVKFAQAALAQTERQALTKSALELIQHCETNLSAVDQKAQS